MKPVKLSYPWASCLSLLLVLALFLLQPLLQTRQLPTLAALQLDPGWLAALSALALLLVLVDLLLFQRRTARLHRQNETLVKLSQQLAEEKKALQRKAHSSSGQTEKLKAFIGDKLLEYIEYDEKYLHFKGIAAEVRHNGIISYDLILAALRQARAEAPDDPRYPEALESLGYLWDLLDLSTADNMALHINNHLCECEDYLFQSQLQAGEAPPFSPVFPAHRALIRALTPLTQASERLQWRNDDQQLACSHHEAGFRFLLDKHCSLLGNENHLVLMAENLLKNALYYRDQAGLAEAANGAILLGLQSHKGQAQLRVCNRGPHIDDDNQQRIYQLGFSTREQGAVHGRGLGLYFVSQIISGYEGKIRHRNLYNQAESYSIRIESGDGLAGSRVQTELVEVVLVDEQPQCQLPGPAANDGSPGHQPQRNWQFRGPVLSVEITARSSGQTHSFDRFDDQPDWQQVEPDLAQPARWRLQVSHQNGRGSLLFEPLDVRGVEFCVTLPLADSAQQGGEACDEDNEEDYLTQVAHKFKAPAEYSEGQTDGHADGHEEGHEEGHAKAP